MNNEKDMSFKLLVIVCSLTILIEIILLIWSSIQVSSLDLNSSSVEAIQLAKKGALSFFTVLFGSWITTSFSIFIPQIRVYNLYQKTCGHKNHTIATLLYVAYFIVPIVNTLYSIYGGHSFLKGAGLSILEMALHLL